MITIYKKMVVIGDLHIPHHDRLLLLLFKKFLKYFKPDILVINGDLLDCFEISRFDKVPKEGQSLQEECDMAYDILKEFRDILPDAQIDYIEGNHDWRLKQYLIKKAPELYGLRGLSIPSLLRLKELKINWVETQEGSSQWIDTFKQYGKLYVGHWNKVNKHSAMTAKNLVEDKGVSLIQNHVHRGGMFCKRVIDGTQLVGIENFCMCSLQPSYTNNVNWQQGWTVVYLKDKSHRFHAYPLQVIRYKFFFEGKEFTV